MEAYPDLMRYSQISIDCLQGKGGKVRFSNRNFLSSLFA